METESTLEIGKEEVDIVFVRKKKTLIVGPKKGRIAFLAKIGAIGIVFIRLLTPLSVCFLGIHTLLALFKQRSFLKSRKLWKRVLIVFFSAESIFYAYMQMKQKKCFKGKSPNRSLYSL